MALATQCPHCFTSFRVANDQLKLHAGIVRCGTCKLTFNGIENLLAPGATPKVAPVISSNKVPVREQQVTTSAIEIPESAKAEQTLNDDAEQNHQQDLAKNPEHNIDASTEALNSESEEHRPADNSDRDAKPDMASVSSVSSTNGEQQESRVRETQIEVTPTSKSEVPIEAGSEAENPSTSEKLAFEPIPEIEVQASVEALEQSSASSQQLHNNTEQSADEVADEVTIEVTVEAANQAEAESDVTHSIEAPSNIDLAVESVEYISTNSEVETIDASSKQENRSDQPALSAHLDFELTAEEQEWLEQSERAKQLELQTRAALIMDDAAEWSTPENERNSLAPSNETEETRDNETSDKNADVVNQNEVKATLIEGEHSTPPLAAHQNSAQENQGAEIVESIKEGELETPDTIDDDISEIPNFVRQAERKQRSGKWPKVAQFFVIFLLILLTAAQLIYFFRVSIAAQFPQTKATLQQLCLSLKCQIKLPAQREFLEISGSELITHNANPQLLALSVQLQNKSSTLQTWPMLEVILKDARGKPVIQRVFTPIEYLENKTQLTKGMQPTSENTLKLHFDTGALKAAGYSVEVFYQ